MTPPSFWTGFASTTLVAVVWSIALLAHGETISAPSVIADILERIARETRSNFEKIETWKGEYEIVTESRDSTKRRLMSNEAVWDGKPYSTVIEASLAFCIAPEKELWQIDYEQLKPVAFVGQDGKSIPFKSGRFVQQSILTPEQYLSFRPRQTYGELEGFGTSLGIGQRRSRVAFVKHRTDSDADTSTTGALIDPLLFFGNGSLHTWERCDMYARGIREAKFSQEQLSRIYMEEQETEKGTEYWFRVKYNVDTPKANEALETTEIYSEAKGLNLVRWYKERAGKRYETWEFDYSNESDILYPEIVRIEKTALTDGVRDLSGTYRCKQCSFNDPIDGADFGLEAFDLANGERVADEIAGTVKAFKDNSLVPLGDFGYGIQDPSSAGISRWFIAANIVVVLGLLIFVTRNRLKSHRA